MWALMLIVFSGLRQDTENRRLPVSSSCVHTRPKTRDTVRNPPLPLPWLILPYCSSNWNKSASAASLAAVIMHQGKQTVCVSVHQSEAPQHAARGKRRCQSSRDPLQHRPPATLLHRPSVLCSGLGRGGTAALPQPQPHRRAALFR